MHERPVEYHYSSKQAEAKCSYYLNNAAEKTHFTHLSQLVEGNFQPITDDPNPWVLPDEVGPWFLYIDPPDGEKRARAADLATTAKAHGLVLHACCQPLLAGIPGIRPSACIDGGILEALHPRREPVSRRKDRGQRGDCLCTESKDIGSYAQACPHSCVYCYANPSE